MLEEWWESIPITDLGKVQKLVDGDDAKSNRYVTEVLKKAKDEGWVLDGQWANPGAQDFIEPDDEQQYEMIDLVRKLKRESKPKSKKIRPDLI